MKTGTIFFLALSFFTASIAIAADIPYIEQDQGHKNKGMCGAGALCMAYASFGRPQDQHDVFEYIAVPSQKHGSGTRPDKLTRDAIRRGFYSVSFSARDPSAFLNKYDNMKESVRIVFSMLQVPDKPDTGHCTTLLEVTDKDVIVHDPAGKPNRHLAKEKFLKMWKGRTYKLTAVSDRRSVNYNCPTCRIPIPDKISCPKCPKAIGLEPKEALGCIIKSCPARMWKFIICPYCGYPVDGVSGNKGLSSKIKMPKPNK